MSNVEFINGLIAKAPHENAPDFVKCNLSIKRVDLINYLNSKHDDWLNVDIKVSKDGQKWYASLNEWKPNQGGTTNHPDPVSQGSGFDEDIPF